MVCTFWTVWSMKKNVISELFGINQNPVISLDLKNGDKF